MAFLIPYGLMVNFKLYSDKYNDAGLPKTTNRYCMAEEGDLTAIPRDPIYSLINMSVIFLNF